MFSVSSCFIVSPALCALDQEVLNFSSPAVREVVTAVGVLELWQIVIYDTDLLLRKRWNAIQFSLTKWVICEILDGVFAWLIFQYQVSFLFLLLARIPPGVHLQDPSYFVWRPSLSRKLVTVIITAKYCKILTLKTRVFTYRLIIFRRSSFGLRYDKFARASQNTSEDWGLITL